MKNKIDEKLLLFIANSLNEASNAKDVLKIIEKESVSIEIMNNVLSCFNIDGIYHFLPKDYKDDKNIFIKCLHSTPEIIKEKINEMSEQDLYKAMKINNSVYRFLPISYKESKNVSLKYLETSGSKWEEVPLVLRKFFLKEPTIVNVLLNNVNIFKYLSDELKSDVSLIRKAFKFNKENIRLVKDISIKKELLMDYLDKSDYVDGFLMDVIVTEFNSDMELMEKAIKNNPHIYVKLDNSKQENIDYIKCLLSFNKKEFHHDKVNVDLVKHKTLKKHFNQIIDIIYENYPNLLIDRNVYQIALERKIISEDYNGALTYDLLNTMLNKSILKKDLEIDSLEIKTKVFKVRKF